MTTIFKSDQRFEESLVKDDNDTDSQEEKTYPCKEIFKAGSDLAKEEFGARPSDTFFMGTPLMPTSCLERQVTPPGVSSPVVTGTTNPHASLHCPTPKCDRRGSVDSEITMTMTIDVTENEFQNVD